MLKPAVTYRFKVDFIPPLGLSEEYQMFLTRQVVKTRINYVKKTIEIWFMVPEEGPMHELTEWFISNPIDLNVCEMDGGTGSKAINRTLHFSHCLIVDHEIIYDYSVAEQLRNYTVWSYEKSSLD